MDSLLKSIREAPLSYLPKVSLDVLAHFWDGYAFRCLMEGQSYDWDINRREFQEWLCKRFQLQGVAAIGDTQIVSSYSLDEADAFRNYFVLLEEFLSSGVRGTRPLTKESQKQSFADLVKSIRERPAMYLGHATFQGLSSYLLGDDRAGRDLGLPADGGRQLFYDFQKWVETKKTKGAPRPWFRVIEFWSGGIDCGHTPGGAFALFFLWLDEHAKLAGQEGLFKVSEESW